jgi:ABC-2 type transport system ATP-binding protein
MEEAQALADRIVVIRDGTIVAEGSPDELGGRASGAVTIRFSLDPATSLPDGIEVAERDDDVVLLRTTDPVPLLHRLTAWSLESGTALRSLSVTPPTLEDVYLELTS